MADTVIGRVFKVYEKDFTGRDGNAVKLYSLKIDGDQDYYGLGSRKPACNDGDEVSFMWQQKGRYKNVIPNTLEVRSKAQAAPQQQQAQAPRAAGGKDQYWAEKDKYDKQVRQRIIMYQSATKDAVELACAALNNGILPTTGQKKTDKWSSFMDVVDQVRDKIYLSYEEAIVKLENDEPLVVQEDLAAASTPVDTSQIPTPPAHHESVVPEFTDPDMPF